MTKVELDYAIDGTAGESLMDAIARAHSVYGLRSVRLSATMDQIHVTYDASRLTPADVDRALHSAGLPVRRLSPAS